MKKDQEGNTSLISLYVDDLIITGNACELITEIKNQLSQEFEMKDLGELHYCLGLEVWRESGKTMITQSKYVREIHNRFNMSDCKVSTIPLEKKCEAMQSRWIKGCRWYFVSTIGRKLELSRYHKAKYIIRSQHFEPVYG